MKTVLVFKTSVETDSNIYQLQPVLNQLMNQNETWNFDLEDCDKILRVECVSLKASVIIEKITNAGFICAELSD